MNIDINSTLLSQCEKTIDKSIMDALSSYSSPLRKAIDDAVNQNREALNELASNAVAELVNSDEFKQSMKTEMKRKLAKVLISQYGGEIQKTVGELKANPASRAKMTLAIDSVMSEILGVK